MAARYLGRSILHFKKCICKSSDVKWLQTSIYANAATSIRMPALSPTMQEGTIVKWHKKEGETISPGDILCDIQTDKAVVSFEIEEEGILAKILKPDDSKDVKLGTIIGVMVDEGEDWQNAEIPLSSGESTTVPSQPATSEALPSTPSTSMPKQHGYGPAVRSLLELYQLKIGEIPATGPHGRVLKGDVLKYIKNKGLQPAPVLEVPVPVPPAPKVTTPAAPHVAAAPAKKERFLSPSGTDGFSDIELTNMRKTIAKRLTESKVTIPHAYSAIECNMKNVLNLRKDLLVDGVKVSVNDFIIKAVAVALQQVPQVNAGWIGDSSKQFSDIDISVAVATDSGLITPIVKDAIGKGIQEISQTVAELAGRARQGKLKLNEFQGGSFTISNLGMFGISEFTAVINPPQACILAVGTSRVNPDSDGNPRTMMTVTLSSDARVVDDSLAAQFLAVFKDTIENPMLMLGQPKLSSQSELTDMEEKLEKLFAK